MLMITN